jgi:hypothetical protein
MRAIKRMIVTAIPPTIPPMSAALEVLVLAAAPFRATELEAVAAEGDDTEELLGVVETGCGAAKSLISACGD